MEKKVNYLNNKDILSEIHKSKMTFCDYDKSEYSDFDLIVYDVDHLRLPENIILSKQNRADRIASKNYKQALLEAGPDVTKANKPKLSQYKFDSSTIDVSDLVFRVITYEHIPLEPGRKKTPKTEADKRARVHFVPFKHYMFDMESDKTEKPLMEVLVSHQKDGDFCLTHGSITNKLARMYMELVKRYGQKSNWRGYSYLDEMQGQALLQLSQMGLQFNEEKSDNPFSYYTASVTNSFTRVLNAEKRIQSVRDYKLVQAGLRPSYTRQLEIEEEIRKSREAAQNDTN